jgi:predicted RNA-binding protein YlqC (UPF0109 family)
MSDKLKPCPFCGDPCTTYTFYGGAPNEWGHCGCRFGSIEQWNHRPAEDAYRAKVRALVEAAKKLSIECEAEFTLDGYWNSDGALVTRKTVQAIKTAIAAVEAEDENS